MSELKVFATAGQAYRFLYNEFGTILRLSWLPLLLVTLIQNVASVVLIGQHDDVSGAFASLTVWAGWTVRALAFLIGTSIVAVALHRVILFGERRAGQFLYLRFGRTEWLFMLPAMAVSAVGAVMILALFLPVWIFAVLFPAALAMIYLITRFSLIFPVTVVTGRCDFAEAQAITRGRFWQLFALWLLVLIPVGLIYGALQRLVAFGTLAVDPEQIAQVVIDTPTLLAMTVLQWFAKIVVAALGVAVLSYSYKALVGRAPDDVLTRQG